MVKIPEYCLQNHNIRLFSELVEDKFFQEVDYKVGNEWIPILGNFEKENPLIFTKRWTKKAFPLKLKDRSNTRICFTTNKNINISLNSEIIDMKTLHFKYNIQFKKNEKFSSIFSKYKIILNGNPDFTWVPHLRPKKKYVIPDHVFRSPVIVYKKGDITIAFLPDLEILTNSRVFPMFLDLNVNKDAEELPFLSYGFGRSKPTGHVFFKHKRRYKMKISHNTKLIFGYYIKFYYKESIHFILKDLNHFFWENYGKDMLYRSLDPQVLPYEVNVKEGLKAIFKRHTYWGEFYINDKECGGTWQRSWMGDSKSPIEYIDPENLEDHKKKRMKEIAGTKSFLGKIINKLSSSPRWIRFFDKVTRHHPIVRRVAEVWNNAWFLNIRTGYALNFFGIFMKNNDWKEKGNEILNSLLQIPRTQGLFPSVILPANRNARDFSFINGVKAFLFTNEFHIVDACLAMYWALKIYQDFNQNELIIKKSIQLKRFIEKCQLKNGAIPTYISLNNNNDFTISDTLLDSASSGACLMFLTELFKINEEKSIIKIIKKIAEFIEKNIIPINKWHDFEPFFSCTQLPLDFYDEYTDNNVMNTLCIYWCTEGFKELYKITKDEHYLKKGECILSILSLFQQVWDMPYISYNTFGGFGVQNADAELSDARQALFVRTYMEYYLETGKEEYMERAIAALRASWALQLLSEYDEICPGNLKDIETINGIDRGCICENYGHSGTDFRVPGYVMFDWGIGTAVMATAYAKKHFGDLFIDFKYKKVWGICGILIDGFEITEN
ncbi:MAG: hypothetical protein GF329_13030, partial [Candidatus Lokiarchaeota archaeon]|nr:hypothetical protein [Candidatus Lokiarchaeota archaeon]